MYKSIIKKRKQEDALLLLDKLLLALFETDKDGYPLRGHNKIAKMQIIAEQYGIVQGDAQ